MRKKRRDPWLHFAKLVFTATPFQRRLRYRGVPLLLRSREMKGIRRPHVWGKWWRQWI